MTVAQVAAGKMREEAAAKRAETTTRSGCPIGWRGRSGVIHWILAADTAGGDAGRDVSERSNCCNFSFPSPESGRRTE